MVAAVDSVGGDSNYCENDESESEDSPDAEMAKRRRLEPSETCAERNAGGDGAWCHW